ncbi:odorant-binding protein-like [Ursus maritimus]|uniref:Odorant-binding protein-like n=1 Tax=Ursus maritimus TaxID=29073 RepID=A0A8M1GSH3_URSMA|nr:odorant-binding protein-like [Ursus maritimus]
MKILLLSLVLAVVCDAQLPLIHQLTQLPGQWETMYLAASNPDKISDNGPFKGYMRRIEVDMARRQISFHFYAKINGQCTEKSVVGGIGTNNAITVDCKYTRFTDILRLKSYDESVCLGPLFRKVLKCMKMFPDEGTNDFQIIDMTPNSIIGYDVNVDEEGNTTDIVLLFGRGAQADEKAVEKFKQFTRQRNIPEENIIKVTGTGTRHGFAISNRVNMHGTDSQESLAIPRDIRDISFKSQASTVYGIISRINVFCIPQAMTKKPV